MKVSATVSLFTGTRYPPCFSALNDQTHYLRLDKTGFCNCAHGAAGPLCQERPLGDGKIEFSGLVCFVRRLISLNWIVLGRCNEYFNNNENDYDGMSWFIDSTSISNHRLNSFLSVSQVETAVCRTSFSASVSNRPLIAFFFFHRWWNVRGVCWSSNADSIWHWFQEQRDETPRYRPFRIRELCRP